MVIFLIACHRRMPINGRLHFSEKSLIWQIVERASFPSNDLGRANHIVYGVGATPNTGADYIICSENTKLPRRSCAKMTTFAFFLLLSGRFFRMRAKREISQGKKLRRRDLWRQNEFIPLQSYKLSLSFTAEEKTEQLKSNKMTFFCFPPPFLRLVYQRRKTNQNTHLFYFISQSRHQNI